MNELLPRLVVAAETKIILVVMDGLGGVRTADRGSELTEARTPNLDRLAKEGSSGLLTIVAPGIIPGSGAGHLALFGYDPLVYELGRGALSAAGVGFELKPGDVAARVNFCTLDEAGLIADRRAGRISSEENERLCKMILESLDLGGRAEAFLVTERDHRALLVLRGAGLSPELSDTDPQMIGVAPKMPAALAPEAEATAEIIQKLLDQVRDILAGERANFILLRGFDSLRELPSFADRYRVRPLAIAGYPMYVGMARLLGMAVAPLQPTFANEVEFLEKSFGDYDFFYIHQKKTDSAGEDGDFEAKVSAIEEVDAIVPRMIDLQPDVICVTGDHSTPSQLRGHSWHPVPFVISGPNVGVDSVQSFNEESARDGGLGHQLAKNLMAFILASAGRLTKFGP